MRCARAVVGTIGNIISFCFFLSPVPTFYRIRVNQGVEGVRPYPYLSSALNCLWWMFYGFPLVSTDNILVSFINGIGLVIELFYIGVYLFYANQDRRHHVGTIILGGILFTVVMAIIAFAKFNYIKDRAVFVGGICGFVNFIMYASPLPDVVEVIETNNVQNMPFWPLLASLANGICWTIYALIPLDLFMLISNGLGALLAVLQLGLYGYYYFHGQPPEPPPEPQLVSNESESETAI